MTVALILVAVLAVAAAGVAWSWRPEAVVRRHVRRKCLVTLKDGQAFSGVLWEADRRLIVLRDATVAETGVPVDGEVLLHRSDVAYVQLP